MTSSPKPPVTERWAINASPVIALARIGQEALDYLEFLQYKRGHQRPRRKWRDIMGAATEPLTGEDAQAWVSGTRQETTEHRETHQGAKL